MPSFNAVGDYVIPNIILMVIDYDNTEDLLLSTFSSTHIGLNHCQSSGTLKVKGAISVIAKTLIVLNRFLNNLTTLSDLLRLPWFKKQAAPPPNTQH